MSQSLESRTVDTVATRAVPVLTPRLDVYESDDMFQLALEMPGVSQSDVEVTFDSGLLTVRGETKLPDRSAYTLRYREYGHGRYERVVELGAAIDTESISAHLDAGVLRVTLPKRAEARARRIAVKPA